jgi:hypothetical protein
MADRSHHDRRGTRRGWWRRLAIGGIASAAIAFYLVLVRKLMTGRAGDISSRPAVAGTAPHHAERPETAFEPTDWSLAPVAAVYVGALVLLVISCLVLIVAYPDALPDVSRVLHINPPGPMLQTDAQADLQRFRAEEDRKLNGYYWVDRQKGMVHIPIGVAMQKLAQTGIDGFPTARP